MPRRDSPCSEDAFVAQHPPDYSSSFNIMLLCMAKIPRELIPRIQEMDCRGQNMMERCTLRLSDGPEDQWARGLGVAQL
jgi:hypothetical protein